MYIVFYGIQKYQCKVMYCGYNITKCEDFQKFIFHPSQYRIPFKQLFLNKFKNINPFEDTTNIS